MRRPLVIPAVSLACGIAAAKGFQFLPLTVSALSAVSFFIFFLLSKPVLRETRARFISISALCFLAGFAAFLSVWAGRSFRLRPACRQGAGHAYGQGNAPAGGERRQYAVSPRTCRLRLLPGKKRSDTPVGQGRRSGHPLWRRHPRDCRA